MSDLFRPAFIHDFGIEITQGEDYPLAFLACPLDMGGEEIWTDTSAFTAEMAIRGGDPDGPLVLDATPYVQLGLTPPPLDRGTAYLVGEQGLLADKIYQCTVAGTTDGGVVIFNDTLGAYTTDGSVVWQCVSWATDHLANILINIPHTVTGALTEWGRGSWSLSVKNDFGNSWFYVDGPAVLRKSSV